MEWPQRKFVQKSDKGNSCLKCDVIVGMIYGVVVFLMYCLEVLRYVKVPESQVFISTFSVARSWQSYATDGMAQSNS